MSNTAQWSFPAKEALTRQAGLPNPFAKPDGSLISSPAEWPQQRAYLKAMLSHYLYGHMPPNPGNTVGEVVSSRPVYGGKAVQEAVKLTFGEGLALDCDIVRPEKDGRIPVIIFNRFGTIRGCPEEADIVLNRGYAIASFQTNQLAPDGDAFLCSPVVKAYPTYDWGAIAVWSWGYSRIIDYFETADWVDLEKIAATGISRGGKVALCAGIYDERIALCAPVCSGCGGLGNLRFTGGRMGEGIGICETAGRMSDMYPYWWTDEFGRYGMRQYDYTRKDMDGSIALQPSREGYDVQNAGKTGDVDLLPFDQHFMRALIAPRAVISLDSVGDTWANPYGTNLSWRAAEEVYRFLDAWGKNAMAFRDGPHGMQPREWQDLIDFCDMIFFGKGENPCIIRSDKAKMPVGLEEGRGTMPPLMHCDWEQPR